MPILKDFAAPDLHISHHDCGGASFPHLREQTSLSPGKIRGDGQMLVCLTMDDSWFAPVALLDLQSGRITRLAGDGVSDLDSPAWTRGGQILANRMLFHATIWKFMPEGK